MSMCTRWVDIMVLECKTWATRIRIECTQYADQVSQECTSWKDEGYNKCDQWADEGHNECSSWADEGHNECCDWAPCSWFCDAFYWVANWVCQGWYWVANWVCKAYHWVANLVCQAYAWVVKAVCVVFSYFIVVVCVISSWVPRAVCVAWGELKCLILSIFGKKTRTAKVKHIFVLMLENRSFDHLLGFSGIRGRDAISGNPTLIDGLTSNSFSNSTPDNSSTFFAGTPADYKLTEKNKDPGHEFADTVTELSGNGAVYDKVNQVYPPINNSGFVADYVNKGSDSPDKCMNCYAEDQVPVITQLAREFAICDNYFSSIPGPTWPNRFFIHAATSGGLDDSPSPFRIVTSTFLDGFRFQNGSFYDKLDDNCIPWIIFRGDALPQVLAVSGMSTNLLRGKIRDFDEFEEKVSDPDFEPKYIFIEPNYGNVLPGTPEDFTCGNSQHPLDDITRGEKLIKKIYEIIRKSPHWEDSVLIVTYDEHGGFFDHVAPHPTVSPGDTIIDPDNNHNNFNFQQLGVRVPCVVISPWIAKNLIDHTKYDHTSILKTAENIFAIGSLTNRDQHANSFNHLFSLTSPRNDTPVALNDPPDSGFHCDDDEEDDSLVSSTTSGLENLRKGKNFDDKEIEPLLRAFMHVAFLRDYHARYSRKDKLIKEFLNIKTQEQAKIYLSAVKKKFTRYDILSRERRLKKIKMK